MSSLRSLLPVLLLLVGPFVAFVLLVHRPAKQQHSALRVEIDRAAEMATALPVRLAELTALSRDVREREAFLATNATLLASEDRMNQFAHRIGGIADRFAIADLRVEPLPAGEFATYRVHPFRLAFVGDVPDAVRFLGELESPALRVELDSVTIGKTDRDGRGPVTAVVQVRTAKAASWAVHAGEADSGGASDSVGFHARRRNAAADPS